MATYSNNTTIKIGTSVAIYRNQIGNGSASDSYTVPAGCYLIVTKAVKGQNSFANPPSLTVTYPGSPSEDLVIPALSTSNPVGSNPFSMLLPSGSVINASLSVTSPLGSASYQVVGQLYQNTP